MDPENTTQDIEQATNSQVDLRELIENTNIAETLDEDLLKEIGQEAKRGYDADKQSRVDWEVCAEEWLKLAGQVREEKTWPWPNSSNVKYPLLTTASMQFAARAYPSLVPSDGQIVRAKVVGKDPTGEKRELAERVSTYMSYQIMQQMYDWEEGMDLSLIHI